MKGRPLLLAILLLIFIQHSGFSQNSELRVVRSSLSTDTVKIINLFQDDTLRQPEIVLSRDQAILLLRKHFLLQSYRALPADTVIKSDSGYYAVKPDTLFFSSRYRIFSDSIRAAVGVLLDIS